MNLLNQALSQGDGVFSGLKTAAFLLITDKTFGRGLEKGYFIAQQSSPQMRPNGRLKVTRTFMQQYIDEIDKALPPRELRGQTGIEIFTPEVVKKLEAINKRWKNRKISPEDWVKDLKRAKREF